MFRSVKNWLTVLILLLVALAMLVAYIYVVPPLTNRLEQQKLKDQLANVNLILGSVPGFVYDMGNGEMGIVDPSALQNTVSLVGMRNNARIVILTKNQGIRVDSGGPGNFDVGDYPMIGDSLAAGHTAQGVVQTASGRYAATAVPLIDAATKTVYGTVLVAASLSDVSKAVAQVQRQLVFATVLALGISLLLGYMASYFIARRLKGIERSAEAIAAGDLSATVPASVEDEIGQLAVTFNIMAERLKSAFAQVEYERDRVEVLLNDLSEGVIGLTAEGTVTIANPASADLLGEPLPVGSTIDERFPGDVSEAWREARREGDVQDVVFVHGDATLEATTYPVAGDADFTSILVLRDVTAQARLERARRDLIANASHEFKTPLFSLAGFLEIIDEGDLSPEEQGEFLGLMRQQVDRLRNLAVSMLDLSKVEAGSLTLELEDVDLDLVARSVLDEFQIQAQSKDLTLTVEDGERLTAWCDEQRLAQILRALVDNAVKFSPSGSTVSVATRVEDKWATVAVTDDGPGIAAADLPHVFERFHRGSEERATTAGAGLGLSIARELTEMMGGTIRAEAGRDRGASFLVRLPRERRRRQAEVLAAGAEAPAPEGGQTEPAAGVEAPQKGTPGTAT